VRPSRTVVAASADVSGRRQVRRRSETGEERAGYQSRLPASRLCGHACRRAWTEKGSPRRGNAADALLGAGRQKTGALSRSIPG